MGFFIERKIESDIEAGTVKGQMVFWDGSKWVHTETSELFWDDVDKELSIGSSAGPEEIIHASANTNDNRAIKIENINAGTAAVSRIIVANDVGSSFFAGYSSGFTQSGAKIPNSSALVASGNRANGMSIVAKGAAAPVRFYAGGNTDAHLRMIIQPDGTIGIGGTPDTDVVLDVQSTTGAFRPPVMDTTARDLLTPLAGMVIYNSTTDKLQVYNSSAWVDLH